MLAADRNRQALAQAGASVTVGTWPMAMNIFLNLLERGKMDSSLELPGGGKMAFDKVYPLDRVQDALTRVDTSEQFGKVVLSVS